MRSPRAQQSRSDGFWYRLGNTIVVLPANQLPTSRVEHSRAEDWQGEVGADYTQCDFIDSRIEVAAQRALYQILKRGPTNRRDSLAILAAVKAGQLRGVFREDQKVSALRGFKIRAGSCSWVAGPHLVNLAE
jgi:hypothetical protein